MSLRHCYSWVGALCIITMQHKNRPRLLQQPRRIFMSSYIFSRLNVLSLLTPHPRVQLELYSCFTYQTYTVLSKVCPPASSVTSKSDRLCKSPSLVLNLPGWRWGQGQFAYGDELMNTQDSSPFMKHPVDGAVAPFNTYEDVPMRYASPIRNTSGIQPFASPIKVGRIQEIE